MTESRKRERYRVPSTGAEIDVPAGDDAQTDALLAHPELQARAARTRRRRAAGERGTSAEELYAEFGTPPAAERDAERRAAGRLLLRLPKSLHAQLTELAKSEGISLNQYVLSLLAQGVGRPETRWHDADCVARGQRFFRCKWRALPGPHLSDVFDRIQLYGECPRRLTWSEGETVSGVTVSGIATTSRFRVEVFRPIDDERCEVLLEEKGSSLLSQLLLDQSTRTQAAMGR